MHGWTCSHCACTSFMCFLSCWIMNSVMKWGFLNVLAYIFTQSDGRHCPTSQPILRMTWGHLIKYISCLRSRVRHPVSYLCGCFSIVTHLSRSLCAVLCGSCVYHQAGGRLAVPPVLIHRCQGQPYIWLWQPKWPQSWASAAEVVYPSCKSDNSIWVCTSTHSPLLKVCVHLSSQVIPAFITMLTFLLLSQTISVGVSQCWRVCRHLCVRVHTHVEAREQPWLSFFGHCPCLFETGYCIGQVLTKCTRLDAHLHVPYSGITNVRLHSWLFTWALRIELRSSST